VTRPKAVTHYCDYDAPGRVHVRAVCGAYIRRGDHDNTPTCADCARIIAARNVEDTEDP